MVELLQLALDSAVPQVALPAAMRTISLRISNELGCYATWFNDHRPHQALEGRTPTEVYRGSACEVHILEPRPKWPVQDQTTRATRIELALKLVEGRSHLPIVEMTRAA